MESAEKERAIEVIRKALDSRSEKLLEVSGPTYASPEVKRAVNAITDESGMLLPGVTITESVRGDEVERHVETPGPPAFVRIPRPASFELPDTVTEMLDELKPTIGASAAEDLRSVICSALGEIYNRGLRERLTKEGALTPAASSILSDEALVAELRGRGWTVTCTKSI